MEKAKVFFTKEITPEAVVRMYEALGRELKGKVAVKMSTGESEKSNHLRPEFVAPIVNRLNGTIVECCTAYGGSRQEIRKHWAAIEERGFKKVAPVEIMDEFGEFEIPIEGGVHMDTDIVGTGLKSYDSVLILSHFKGHMMGGFGGALKNISIGIASSHGKAKIHSAASARRSRMTSLRAWLRPAREFSITSAERIWRISTSQTASPWTATATEIPTSRRWRISASSPRSTR